MKKKFSTQSFYLNQSSSNATMATSLKEGFQTERNTLKDKNNSIGNEI